MRLLLTALALSATAVAFQPALASESGEAGCGNAPQSQWMSKDDITAKATEMGYQVRSVKVEDGCYEVYAKTAKGERAEVYMNPVTAEVVRTKAND